LEGFETVWLHNEEGLCLIDLPFIICLIHKFSSLVLLWSEVKTSVSFTDTDMGPNTLQNKLYLLTRVHLTGELPFGERHGHYQDIVQFVNVFL
jgi:hypothetical protein